MKLTLGLNLNAFIYLGNALDLSAIADSINGSTQSVQPEFIGSSVILTVLKYCIFLCDISKYPCKSVLLSHIPSLLKWLIQLTCTSYMLYYT